MRTGVMIIGTLLAGVGILFVPSAGFGEKGRGLDQQVRSLRTAIADLAETWGPRYPRGGAYLDRLEKVKHDTRRLDDLRREALLANPLLDFEKLLIVKRKPRGKSGRGAEIGFPSNHECNSSLPRGGWDNEIAVLASVRDGGTLRTLYRPENGGYVGEIDLHPSAGRLLFTRSDRENWTVWELPLSGAEAGTPRRVSDMPADTDAFDGCYVPGGRIVFCSTASFQSIPCWHGRRRVSSLYAMDGDGKNVRQLCFDQDHDLHPTVMPNGQILYNRWDYTGIIHIYLRTLMLMNPDGTAQRAIYGSNTWFPNALYFTRPIPGHNNRFVSVLSGYHGPHRMGRLVLLDTGRGWYGREGIVHEFPHRGREIEVEIKDTLVAGQWPMFLNPWPLGDPQRPDTCGKYLLASCKMNRTSPWAVYLVDVFDNVIPLYADKGFAILEPVPLAKRPVPRQVPDRVDPDGGRGTLFLHDIYKGPGLAGVPKGTIKRLRVFAYHFGYRDLAGPDKIGYGGPWEAMRIIGTVPVSDDGSAVFTVPSRTPLALQALDADGKAVQLMRSWMTLMPGERMSCVGCHESVGDVPDPRAAAATNTAPVDIAPWRGPPRGFDFAREVQPVLDAYCVRCHDGSSENRPDLRPLEEVKSYRGKRISGLGRNRMHPVMKKSTGGNIRYTPAYDALVPYIRRVGIEDDASLLVPGEYCADTSPLIRLLAKGHHGVRPDRRAWDRLVTWIDLNAPCHGTWHEVHPFPTDSHERRTALRKRYGGPPGDPERVPELPRPSFADTEPVTPARSKIPAVAGWPFDAAAAKKRQREAGADAETSVEFGGITMTLVCIPAGTFLMGTPGGPADERPVAPVRIEKPFRIGAREVTNAQFRVFDPDHAPAYYTRRHARQDDKGLRLDGADQPAVRVSWRQAVAFCRWLSEKTGRRFALPTEAQWEYACRAGSGDEMWFGAPGADCGQYENLGDRSFSRGLLAGGKQVTGGVEHLVIEGAALADTRFDDGAVVTAPVGSYRPNPWGLYDCHGNAAEWTRSDYRSYPRRAGDGRKVIRGGSFFDHPKRAGSGRRWAYPAWRRVFNVGFRVVCLD